MGLGKRCRVLYGFVPPPRVPGRGVCVTGKRRSPYKTDWRDRRSWPSRGPEGAPVRGVPWLGARTGPLGVPLSRRAPTLRGRTRGSREGLIGWGHARSGGEAGTEGEDPGYNPMAGVVGRSKGRLSRDGQTRRAGRGGVGGGRHLSGWVTWGRHRTWGAVLNDFGVVESPTGVVSQRGDEKLEKVGGVVEGF